MPQVYDVYIIYIYIYRTKACALALKINEIIFVFAVYSSKQTEPYLANNRN